MSDRPVEPPYNPHDFPHFEPPYPTKKCSDVMYEVSGETRAENHLITTAQDEFLSCWLNDKRMTARLQTWSASVGLPEIINDVAAFLDRVTDRYGFSRRANLGRIPPSTPHIRRGLVARMVRTTGSPVWRLSELARDHGGHMHICPR
jgi:hypothetical protein